MATFILDTEQKDLTTRVISSANVTIDKFKSAINVSLDSGKKIDRKSTRELKTLIQNADKLDLIDNRIINAKNLSRKVNYIRERDFGQERIIRLLAREEEANEKKVINVLHKSDAEIIKEIRDVGNALVTGKYKGKKIKMSDDTKLMSDLLDLGNTLKKDTRKNKRNKRNKKGKLGNGAKASLAIGGGALALGGLGFGLGLFDNDKDNENTSDPDIDKEKDKKKEENKKEENKNNKDKKETEKNKKSKNPDSPEAKAKHKDRVTKFLSKLRVPDEIKSLFKKAFIIDILLSAPDLYEAFEEGDNKRICMIIGNLVGAAAGSIAGASVGSVIPFIGTAVFGFLGGWAGSELGEVLGEKLYEGFSNEDVEKAEEKNKNAIVPSLLPEKERKQLEKDNVALQVKEKPNPNPNVPNNQNTSSSDLTKLSSDIEYKINSDGSVEEKEPELPNIPKFQSNTKIPEITPVFKLPEIVKVNKSSPNDNTKPQVIVVKQADINVTSEKSVFDLIKDILGNASDNIGNSLMESVNDVLKKMGINVSAFGGSVGGGSGSAGGYIGDSGGGGGSSSSGSNSGGGSGSGGGGNIDRVGGDQRYYSELTKWNDRGTRNINPGNVKAEVNDYYVGQIGRDEKKHAIFATKEAGIAGIINRLYRYNGEKKNKWDDIGGRKTVRQIMSSYAPEYDNRGKSAGYIRDCAKAIGVNPDDPIDFKKNPELMKKFVKCIMMHETYSWKAYSEEEIDKGIEIGMDVEKLGKEAAFEKHKQWLVAAEGGKKGQAIANLERENQRKEEDAKNGGPPSRNGQGVESKIQINETTTLGSAVSSVYASQNDKYQGNVKYYINTAQRGAKYKDGRRVYGKDITQGYIDCSGWVRHINRQMIQQVNANAGKEVFGKKARDYFEGVNTAADMISSVSKMTGHEYTKEELTPDKIKEGMMIGIRGGGHAKGRHHNIGHIVQVYKDPQTGEMMVTESTPGKNKGELGVIKTPYAEWYRKNAKKDLYGANVMELADPKLLEEAKQKAVEEAKNKAEEEKKKAEEVKEDKEKLKDEVKADNQEAKKEEEKALDKEGKEVDKKIVETDKDKKTLEKANEKIEEKKEEKKEEPKEEKSLIETLHDDEAELSRLKYEKGDPKKIAELEARIASNKEKYVFTGVQTLEDDEAELEDSWIGVTRIQEKDRRYASLISYRQQLDHDYARKHNLYTEEQKQKNIEYLKKKLADKYTHDWEIESLKKDLAYFEGSLKKSEVKQANPEAKKSADGVASAAALESATKLSAQSQASIAARMNAGGYAPTNSQNAGGVVTLPPKVIDQNKDDKNKGGEGGGSPTFDTGDSHSAIINKDPLRK